MAQILSVRLNKGEANNLGFRLQGGKDFGTPLVIQKVNIGSPAEKAGLLVGDSVIKINSTDVYNLRHKDAQDVIIRAGPSFEITIQRGGSTWKPSVTPLPKTVVDNSFSPVTKTSLAAKPQPSIGAIGTGHNLSAKPFSPQLNGAVNGGPKFVNKQYNSPLGLYSEESIAETLSAQAEVLSTGVLGVNFKKNEKNYDASTSAVFRMVQEADKEPREQEAEPDSGVVTAPLGMVGLRHVQAPENKPAPTPQLPPGQNICAECERLIVGVFVRIKEKSLHVECFKCATCGTSLKNVGYYNINQKLYCDIHAKLAARSNPPAPNLVPVTVSPGGKAPVGTISAALASHPLPSTAAPLSPHLTSGNITAQPFQSGSNFSSPRLFSSVSAPLSPTVNNYPTPSKISPAPASFTSPVSAPTSERGRFIQNVIWPPPTDSKEPELPTATPLYFPPHTHIKVPVSTYHQEFVKEIITDKENTSPNRRKKENVSDKYLKANSKDKKEELIETEELDKIAQNIEAKMSLCSTEVTNITEKQVAVEKIETATETQMLVESVLQQRPKSPPPMDIQPKIEVETEPLISGRSSELTRFSNEPRVVTRVCVCTNSCCNANSGELCESCPMRDLKRPKDYQRVKLKSVENSVPKRYGSPIITGVSVTINNPGRIKEAVRDLFTQIPDKKTTSALGSALEVAPKEPFTPINSSHPTKPVSLPEETKPYLPPERPITKQATSQPCIQKKPEKPDTPFVSALRIAPERSFTPVNMPAPVKEKKPKEDPILKDLPKPTQWMSMVSALTTAPERPYSPFITESSTIKQAIETEVHVEKINKMKQEIMKRSVQNDTILPKPFRKSKQMDKFEVVNNERLTPQMHFPPVTDELKSKCEYKVDYSEVKSEISNQIIEQAHLDEKVLCNRQYNKERTKSSKFQSPKTERECKENIPKCHEVCNQSNEQSKENVIEKQNEEAILKKPLELVGYLQKPEYLPQYQLCLNYDETIQLPHHKDIKKLLSTDQNKQVTKQVDTQVTSSTQGQLKQTISSKHESTFSNKESKVITKPLTTLQAGELNLNTPQIVFQPLNENEISRSLLSPRPGSITPSMINKPAPILPYYQENLVSTQLPPPEINVFDPKSPAISRSPSPCPDRAPSPFRPLFPRAVSPAPGPPPNPLNSGQPIRKFTKEDRKLEEAKKNISEYIPQYREKVDGIGQTMNSEVACSTEKQTTNIMAPSINKYVQNTNLQSCSFGCVERADVHVTDSTITPTVQQESATNRNEVKASSAKQKSTTKQKKKSTFTEKQLTYKSSTSPFEKTEHPVINEPGVIGMHITNPQPIISPFITQEKVQAQSESSTNIQTSPPPKLQSQFKSKDIPLISNKDKSNVKPTPSISETTRRVSANASTVSQPNAGSGGGRQAGAIGVAPKRGRGVLNVGGFIGARIPICGHCHGQIRGPFITALGKIWCPEHFICNTPSCKRPLQDLGFVEEQGQLYCEYCFEQYIAPPCAKCGAKIKGDCLKAIGKNFHPECFSCSYCGKLFGNSPFFLEDGQPYCENDWNELFTTKCFACGYPVEAGDRWVEALNNNYHSQCFNCTMCKKNLEGQSFFAKGGRPFCKNHAR